MKMYSEANKMCVLEEFFVSFTSQEFSQTMCTEVLNLICSVISNKGESSTRKLVP